MKVIQINENTTRQAKTIAEQSVGYNNIRILLNDKLPSKNELYETEKIKKRYSYNLYSKIIFELTHIEIRDNKKAEEICKGITSHKNNLNRILKRDVGIEIAALDYVKNIVNFKQDFSIIEKSKMESIAKQAIVDDKTDVYSSSLLHFDINKEIERTKRYGGKFSLVFIDIDKFKRINDTYGHITGDKILMKISDLIESNIRKSDSVYRYGGDEFVVILPKTNNREAVNIAVKIKKFLQTKKILNIKGDHTITLSMGIVTFGDYDFENLQKLLQAADKALYKAKRTGRNKICIYKGKNIKEASSIKDFSEKQKKRKVIMGRAIVKGIARGFLFKYKNFITNEVDIYSINEDELDNELSRIYEAVGNVYKDLDQLHTVLKKNLDKKHTDIINTHKLILKDQELLAKIEKTLKEKKINSEAIIKSVFMNLENQFENFSGDRFKSKAKDIADIGNKILKELLNIKTNSLDNIPPNSIIFAERILPTDIIQIDRKKLNGIISIEGSAYSHAGILARAFHIPYITNIDVTFNDLTDKSEILLDSDAGKVILNPTVKDKERFHKKEKYVKKIQHIDDRYINPIQLSFNNEKIYIKANIDTAEDIDFVKKYKPDEIGLTRLEFIYLLHSQKPSQDELYEQLDEIFTPVKDIPITIRLLDIGGDKSLPYDSTGKKNYSKMGIMGIRYLLERPDLLTDQIKTCLLLNNHYNINLLLPMVTLPQEIKNVKKLINQIQEKSIKKPHKRMKIGAMIEVPSSVFLLDRILEEVDFISIGSNDLIQYTMVADREDNKVSEYYKKGNEIIIDIMKKIFNQVKIHGIACTLCGELAGNTNYTDRLLKSGLRNFSVPPQIIPALRKRIHQVVTK